MKAIVVRAPGGPDALALAELPLPEPRAGEVVVRIAAAGVNYIDVYHRTGRYPLPVPFTPGQEAAGTVVTVGPDVSDVREGDRVAWVGVGGAYAEFAAVPAARLVPVPARLADRDAAACLLQGMTAHYLTHDTHPIRPGEWVLIHAGAGGVGLLLTQMANRLGAVVVTTVSTAEKEDASRDAGAQHVIRYTDADFVAEVKRLTGGAGVQVVYDSVGRGTFEGSLRCLTPRGLLVLFGASSGPVPAFDPMTLGHQGSLFLTRPSLFHYVADRASLLHRAEAVFHWAAEGALRQHVDRAVPLAEAARAHADLEARATLGKLLLLPGD